MIYVARVGVGSRDNPRRVDAGGSGSLSGAGARAGGVDGSYDAGGSAEEAVMRTVRVNVKSGDNSFRVDAKRFGSFIGARARGGNIEGGYPWLP